MRRKIAFLTAVLVMIMLVFTWLFVDIRDENMALVLANKETATLVIDPGHGGFDGGAVAKDGTSEKDINLAIALELKEIAQEHSANVIMTREIDESLDNKNDVGKRAKEEDLKKRRKIIEEADADLTISIHLNSYPSDASVYGAQVFYASGEQKRTNMETYEQLSKTYGENVQKSLEINILDGRERRAMSKNDTYLMRNTKAPFILVECGFLSNADECNRLKTADYQRLLAESIWEGINTSLGLEKEQKIQVIQSANKR